MKGSLISKAAGDSYVINKKKVNVHFPFLCNISPNILTKS